MRKLILGVLCLSLAGCSVINGDDGYFRNRAKDYYWASLVPPLEMPNGIEAPIYSDKYPVPAHVPQGDTRLPLDPPNFEQGEV